MNPLNRDYENFRDGSIEAPAEMYAAQKELTEILGCAVDSLMASLRDAGLKADGCDMAFSLEAAMYNYVKQSNPDSTLFIEGEGLGESLGAAPHWRAKAIIKNLERDRDFLTAHRS